MSLNWDDRSRAVLIGTATYHDSEFLPVPAAANSLRGFHDVLADPALCGWPAARLTVIRDAPDAAAVVKQLRELAAETTGALLVYFVGHGTITSDAKLCLALSGTDAAHPDITGLEYDRVRRAMLDSPARIKIVILDCCHSGRAIQALAGPAGIADTAAIRGAYTLTASDQAAHVPPLKDQAAACTSFTGELLRLIRDGIPWAPARLTFADLYPQLRQRLREHGLPEPNQRGTGNAADYPFTRNAACAGQAPAATDSGYSQGRKALPAGRSSGGTRLAAGRRTIVLGGLAAGAAAAVPAALILSEPARPSPARVPAPFIVKDSEQLFNHSAVDAVAFRPRHSTTLASCGSDGALRLWDTTTATSSGTLPWRGHVGEVAFSPDGEFLASGDDGGPNPAVLLWEMTTRRPAVLPGQIGRVFAVAFSRDGSHLASGSPGTPVTVPDYHVQLWDVASRHPATGFSATFPVHAVAFNRDGHKLAYAGGDAGVYPVQLRDLVTGNTTTFPGHTGIVNAVGFNPDGNTLASASDDMTIRLTDVATGNSTVLRGHTSAVGSVSFSPGGKTLASGSADCTIRLWDLASQRTIAIYRGHTGTVTSVAFSPDGTTLASGSYDTTIRLWQAVP